MKKIDDILKSALTPNDEPDFWLNQQILSKAKEATQMKRNNLKRLTAVVCSCTLIFGIGSVSIYAARKLLLPQQVTEQLADQRLMDAFSSENAILINETQSYGGYDVTLFGIISGKDLSEYAMTGNDEIHNDRTYTVVSIAKSDDTPLPSTSQDAYSDISFLVSPLIEGYEPWLYNAFTMQGGYSEIEENGVLYRISECDNIEIFADHQIYLSVSEGAFFDANAYTFDPTSGEIARNETYSGLNALFRLPIDPSKADPKAAQDLIDSIDNPPKDDTDTAETETDAERIVKEFMEKITPETIADYAVPVESASITKKPDADGYFSYAYEIEGRGGGSAQYLVTDVFSDQQPGMAKTMDYSFSDGLDSLIISTLTLNADGTVTFTPYIPK